MLPSLSRKVVTHQQITLLHLLHAYVHKVVTQQFTHLLHLLHAYSFHIYINNPLNNNWVRLVGNFLYSYHGLVFPCLLLTS